MSGPIQLFVDHTELVGMEWSMSCEEVLGGTGRATLVVQDRENTWEPRAHWDVKVVVRSSGWVLFRGEIITPGLELPVGFPWRRWVLDCADYNDEPEQRAVGALDGSTWVDVDGFGDYVNVDPYANTLSDDRTTVQVLLDHYIRVDGEALETTTYVGQYLTSIDPTIYWLGTTLRAALEDLASEITVNLQFWIDPDLKFHWAAIPAWQDLLQEVVTEDASLVRLLPEFAAGTLSTAPVNISDVAGLDPNTVGCRELTFKYDGGSMPEQVYVNGGTGYVYNSGVVQFVPTTIDSTTPQPVFPGHYILTFNAPTLVYSRHTTGYIALPGVAYGTPGEQVYVNPIVVPIDPVALTGGHFWAMKTGGKPGWLVSFWSNSLGYGDISVVPVPVATPTPDAPPPPPAVPTVGIGGSGWANGDVQNPFERQAYFDAPVSVTQAQRDSIGSQVLYRGSTETLRGSCKVGGVDAITGVAVTVDGWRVGQLVRIVDARLPNRLNGRYFIIQRVAAELLPTTDVRVYRLDWGDGPVSRYSAQKRDRPPTPAPAVAVLVTVEDVAPEPGAGQNVTGQLVNMAGLPWAIAGKTVDWALLVLDSVGNVIAGQGSIVPLVSITDQAGTAHAVLTAGDRLGLTYFVYADVAVL